MILMTNNFFQTFLLQDFNFPSKQNSTICRECYLLSTTPSQVIVTQDNNLCLRIKQKKTVLKNKRKNKHKKEKICNKTDFLWLYNVRTNEKS